MAFFVRALPAGRADAVRARVEAAAARHAPQEGDDAWDTYFAFLQCLIKRAAKVGWLLVLAGALFRVSTSDTSIA